MRGNVEIAHDEARVKTHRLRALVAKAYKARHDASAVYDAAEALANEAYGNAYDRAMAKLTGGSNE